MQMQMRKINLRRVGAETAEEEDSRDAGGVSSRWEKVTEGQTFSRVVLSHDDGKFTWLTICLVFPTISALFISLFTTLKREKNRKFYTEASPLHYLFICAYVN